jgi:hypothetical protein
VLPKRPAQAKFLYYLLSRLQIFITPISVILARVLPSGEKAMLEKSLVHPRRV